MALSIRLKLLGFVGFMVLIILTIGIVIHILSLEKTYLTAIEWRSATLATNLLRTFAESGKTPPYTEKDIEGLDPIISCHCPWVTAVD